MSAGHRAGAPHASPEPTDASIAVPGGRGAVMAHDWYPEPLPANVVLGEGTWLYSAFAFLHCRSTRPRALATGPRCGIYDGSFFELGPEGEVAVGACSTLVGVTVATHSRVRIGSHCFLAHEVVIADDAFTTSWRRPARGVPGDGRCSVELGDDVWVGANAVLLGGARLGDGVIVGAGSVVDFEVPPGAIVAGHPARIVGEARGAPPTARRDGVAGDDTQGRRPGGRP